MKHEKPMVTIELEEYEILKKRSMVADDKISCIYQHHESIRYKYLSEGDRNHLFSVIRITDEFTKEQCDALLQVFYNQVCKWADTHIKVSVSEFQELNKEQAEAIKEDIKRSVREKIRGWFKLPASEEKGG